MRNRHLFLAAAVGLAAANSTFAQTSQPSTTPAKVPLVEEVIKLSPLAAKTKGTQPKDAIENLAKLAGAQVVTAKYREQSNNAPPPLLEDIWAQRQTSLTFDLEDGPFWKGMDRLLQAADVRAIAVGDGWMTLYPGGSKTQATFYGAAARVDLQENGMGSELAFTLDPRVQVCRVGSMTVDEMQDAEGHDLAHSFTPPDVQGEDREWDGSIITQEIQRPNAKDAGRTKTLRGSLAVSVVISQKKITAALTGDSHSNADGWVVVVNRWEKERLPLNQDGYVLELTLQPPVGVVLDSGLDLRMLVSLRDKSDMALKPVPRGAASKSEGNAVRQKLEFYKNGYDQDVFEPDSLVLEIPLEVKHARLPFEFEKIGVP